MDKRSKPEKSRRKPYIIACIPAYNEEKTLAKVILKARKYVDKVIVCDDGSTDMTAEIAEALRTEAIRHERNIDCREASWKSTTLSSSAFMNSSEDLVGK